MGKRATTVDFCLFVEPMAWHGVPKKSTAALGASDSNPTSPYFLLDGYDACF